MRFKKIYILTPPATLTGGPEALFQLSDAINKQGGSGITLFSNYHQDPIPEDYKKYETITDQQLEISPENLIVLPEVWTHLINDPNFSNISKAVWWLSVDNNGNRNNVNFKDDTIHLYQSYYAEDFLKSKGTKNMLPIFDYLSDSYFEDRNLKEKKNLICYSIKGERIANQIKPYLPDYEFVMLNNMTRDGVIETLRCSKVFIDFGHHPGKDRIPREAALLNNCVITNRKGSANFQKDIPILDRYKIENEDITQMVNLIKDCIENFNERINDFKKYRKEIQNQKKEFFNQVKQIIK
jgi:hypothetical protein